MKFKFKVHHYHHIVGPEPTLGFVDFEALRFILRKMELLANRLERTDKLTPPAE